MSDLRADSPALGLAGPKPPGERWPLSRWLMLIALVCAAHVGLLFMFGARKQIVPRTATDVPTLKLAGSSGELLALNDPTLFALPHPGDFVTAMWSWAPVVEPPSFPWTEPPRWLPLSADRLMTVFNRFMQTNQFAGFALQLKPPVRLSTPAQSIEPTLAQVSTLRVEGDLMQRRLLTPMYLPSWPYADVIAPSKVQLLVNEAGNVVSAIVLPSDNSLEALSHYDVADQGALELARAARFAPAPRLTIGQMIFTWHTVPPPATNSPAASP
ncbi:MAG: hypothetical protein ABSD57_03170 [Verrucomicrobiota bacterium]|jgi:hypothetical protein